MCGPAALTLAATAVTMAGQVQSGLYANKVARNQAIVAQQNKQLAREGAIDELSRGQEQQRQLGREVAQRVGSQEARMAANNVDITTGSAARTIDDTQTIGADDSAALSENVRRQVKSMQIDAWGYETEQRAAKSAARQAIVATAFGVAETALGGATQYSKFKAGRGR